MGIILSDPSQQPSLTNQRFRRDRSAVTADRRPAKLIHAALLLLILGGPGKRSTQKSFSDPQTAGRSGSLAIYAAIRHAPSRVISVSGYQHLPEEPSLFQ